MKTISFPCSKGENGYAFEEFYKSISSHKEAVSNIIAGATTDFCVDLMNQAIYKHSVEMWKPEFNIK